MKKLSAVFWASLFLFSAAPRDGYADDANGELAYYNCSYTDASGYQRNSVQEAASEQDAIQKSCNGTDQACLDGAYCSLWIN